MESAPAQPGLTTISGYHQVTRRSAAVTAPSVDEAGAVAGSRSAATGVPSPPDDPDAPPLPPPLARPGRGRRGSAGAGCWSEPERREVAPRSVGDVPDPKLDRPAGGGPAMPGPDGPVFRTGGTSDRSAIDVPPPAVMSRTAVPPATRSAVATTAATTVAACTPATMVMGAATRADE